MTSSMGVELDLEAREFVRAWQITSPGIARDYIRMRGNGESHNMAAICATGKSPALNTDTTFRAGKVNGNQFASCPQVGEHHVRLARMFGVNTSGRTYMSGLARFPGDPEAWVRGRGDVSRIAEKRGWGVEGAVTVRPRETEPTPDVTVGEDIVIEAGRMLRKENPGMSVEESREKGLLLRSGATAKDVLRVADVPSCAIDECPDF